LVGLTQEEERFLKGYRLRMNAGFVLHAEVYTGLGDLRSVQSVLSARDDVAVAADGTWHHFAFTYVTLPLGSPLG
jgi:hypothetical protein